MKERFETSEEDPWLMGVVIRGSRPRRAASIEPILRRCGEQRDETSGRNHTIRGRTSAQRELERDQHRGAERGEPDEVAPPRHDGDDEREDGAAPSATRAAGQLPQAPHPEGRVAVGLEADVRS